MLSVSFVFILMFPPILLVFPEYAKYLLVYLEGWDVESTQLGLQLNQEGRQKVKEYMEDLLLIEKYRFLPPENRDYD